MKLQQTRSFRSACRTARCGHPSSKDEKKCNTVWLNLCMDEKAKKWKLKTTDKQWQKRFKKTVYFRCKQERSLFPSSWRRRRKQTEGEPKIQPCGKDFTGGKKAITQCWFCWIQHGNIYKKKDNTQRGRISAMTLEQQVMWPTNVISKQFLVNMGKMIHRPEIFKELVHFPRRKSASGLVFAKLRLD